MAKNYDEYGYDEGGNNKTSLIRKILIVLMVIISIFLIIYLIVSCTKKPSVNDKPSSGTNSTFDYEGQLLDGAKKYFSFHNEDNPSSPGECSIVELQTLSNDELVERNKFSSCNQNTTYVKLCMLEDNKMQFTPWLSCLDYNSEEKYGELHQGTMKDIIADKTYVEFKFTAQKVNGTGEILGDSEVFWKDEIPYEKYKTLSTTKYYRYRDKLYQWELIKRTYYSNFGSNTDASKIKDYYVSAPNSIYNQKGEKATVYKWYTSTGTKEYYMNNGAKYPSITQPTGYPYKDTPIDVTRYKTRTVTGTYAPTLYYVCATSASGTKWIYQTSKCGTTNNPQYNYTREKIYSCATEADGSLVRANAVSKDSTCKKYSEWSSPTEKKCDTSKKDVCQSVTVTFYYWYRLKNEVRKYYPSNASSSEKEKAYFTSSPIKNAIKDESTKTTAYKWYKEEKTNSTKYTALPPNGYYKAVKSSNYKWTDWTNWNKDNPKVSDGRDRSIETKTKIKLQEIKGVSSDSWENLSDDYLSEEDLIKLFNEKGYKVKTLEDITNNGQIRYQLVTFVRNKKESM